jgi:hypothetical protein
MRIAASRATGTIRITGIICQMTARPASQLDKAGPEKVKKENNGGGLRPEPKHPNLEQDKA